MSEASKKLISGPSRLPVPAFARFNNNTKVQDGWTCRLVGRRCRGNPGLRTSNGVLHTILQCVFMPRLGGKAHPSARWQGGRMFSLACHVRCARQASSGMVPRARRLAKGLELAPPYKPTQMLFHKLPQLCPSIWSQHRPRPGPQQNATPTQHLLQQQHGKAQPGNTGRQACFGHSVKLSLRSVHKGPAPEGLRSVGRFSMPELASHKVA